MQKKALGKGLKALFPEADSEDGLGTGTADLKVSKIIPNPEQPRKAFAAETLAELAESIRQKGVIQPIIVRRENDRYVLVAGERRWRAVKQLGMTTIPAIVRSAEGVDLLELALIENVQREDLNPMEEAAAYKRLIDDFELTQEEIASRVGKARSTVANFLRLLQLPAEIREDLAARRLTLGHAKALLSCGDTKSQLRLRKKILNQEMSVRTTEKRGGKKRGRVAKKRDVFLDRLERDLQDRLLAKVRVLPEKKGGKIVIPYSSDEELDRIVELLKP